MGLVDAAQTQYLIAIIPSSQISNAFVAMDTCTQCSAGTKCKAGEWFESVFDSTEVAH